MRLLSRPVSVPPPRTCALCGQRLAPGAVYYRFTLVLEAEQDVLDPSPSQESTEDALATLLERLETGPESAQALEEQVHWRRGGVVCATCRTVVMRTLSSPPESAGPH